MQIPPLQLPSNPEKYVYLREATVEDCEFFAETDSDSEEVMATQVLELLQSNPEKYIDPRTMTADDRRLAAFWYFISTAADTVIHAPYQCPHCGQQHDPLIDMRDIGARYTSIAGRPWRTIEHEGRNLIVHPRNGYLMEELEALRVQSSAGEKPGKMLAIIDRHDVVGTLQFAEDNSGRDLRIEAMEKWVRALTLTSYEALREKRDAALESMRHGLNTAMHEGQMILVTDPIQCEEKEEAAATTRLRIPFRLGEMLPRLL